MNLTQYYHQPDYEYLCRWPCACRLATPCRQCNTKGYLEEWLPLDKTFEFKPITIMGYRLAGMPSSTQLYFATTAL